MKFLVDAQLPRALVRSLRELGYEAQHTWSLDFGNRTPDAAIASIADREAAIVISKDLDFMNSHILSDSPKRLLLVSTGNISNRVLIRLFEQLNSNFVAPMKICCIGAGTVGGPTMAMIARKCADHTVSSLDRFNLNV